MAVCGQPGSEFGDLHEEAQMKVLCAAATTPFNLPPRLKYLAAVGSDVPTPSRRSRGN